VGNGIAWLDDIQQFYRERSVIEKEYSAKLSALAKKYYEKKAKKSGTISVGDTPAMTPGSLERFVFGYNYLGFCAETYFLVPP
jgi:formin-binding protein 1